MNAMERSRRGLLTVWFLAVGGAGLLLSSCSSVPVQESKPSEPPGAARPVWSAGDRWVHTWSAGTEKGVKTAEARGLREVRGVQYQVLRMGAIDIYFTADLHWAWAASVAESRVTARAVPPLPWFKWPLQAGGRWEYQGTLEDQKHKESFRDSYKILGVESVAVPAGTFQAFKIVREAESVIADQYWYAPDVRWYVKWVGRRGKEEFEEVLQEYRPADSGKR
ncbi:MAG: hypothetical protein H6Q05_4666 [Acidobacteria bacterium]|nr:hypothetical protein [Acidobacteriota bacterium]